MNQKHFNMQDKCDFFFQLSFRTFNSPNEKKLFSKLHNRMVFCEACNTHISGLQNLVQHYDGRKHKNNFENLTNSTIVRHLEGVDGLVGLEYVIELAHAPKEICMCLLCIKKCDKHEIVSHLKSSNHVEKYLQKHFPLSYAKVNEYLGSYKEIKEAFLSLMCAMIEKEPLHATMQPSVFLFKDFERDQMMIYDLIQSKFHHKETLKMQLAVTEEIIQLKSELTAEGPVMSKELQVENSLKRLHSVDKEDENDVILIQPKIPKIDLSACESDELIQKCLEATKGFFSNRDNHKLHELKRSVEKAAMEVVVEPAPVSLTNTEVEFLMINFEKLEDSQQKNLLNYLHYLQKKEPERFKMLRSPFLDED